MQKTELSIMLKRGYWNDEYLILFEKIYDYNFKNFNELKEFVECYFLLKNKSMLINFYKDYLEKQITFSKKQFLIFIDYRTENKKDSMSHKFLIAKYSDKIDIEKQFQKRVNNIKKSSSLEYYIEKMGLEAGTKRYNEIKQSKVLSLESFILKYGEELGRLKWKNFCNRNKGNQTLERMIELYGLEEGTKKFNETKEKLKNKNTLEYHIKLYGKEQGTIKYKERNLKNSITTKNDKNAIWVIGSENYKKWTDIMVAKGFIRPPEEREKQFEYYRECWKVTFKQKLKTLLFFEMRGSNLNEIKNYAIDHKISISFGYKNNIPPEIIGNINNLQMLPAPENSRKNKDCYSIIDFNEKKNDINNEYFKYLENMKGNYNV